MEQEVVFVSDMQHKAQVLDTMTWRVGSGHSRGTENGDCDEQSVI